MTWLIIFPSILLLMSFQDVEGSAEARLIYDLMENYSKESRPVFNSSDHITVNITLTLAHILHLDEKREVFHWVVWLRQDWYDEYLVWDPADYEGKDLLHLSMSRIWSPDLYVYNLVGESINVASSFIGMGREHALIYPSGHVLNVMPVRLETSCKVNLHSFPFDQQVCRFTVGSWVYSERSLRYELGDPPLPAFENIEAAWQLMNITSKRSLYEENSMELQYSYIHFDIHLKRNALFYLLNILIPSYLLSGVMLMSLFLPPDCGERMSVGLTVFMSYSVYTLIISGIVPDSSSQPPLICVLFTVNMVLTLFTIGWNVFVIRLEYTSDTWTRPPPVLSLVPRRDPFSRNTNSHRNTTSTSSGSSSWLKRDQKLLDRQPEVSVARHPEVGDDRQRDIRYENHSSASSSLTHDVTTAPPIRERVNYKAEWRRLADVGDRIIAVIYVLVHLAGLAALWGITH